MTCQEKLRMMCIEQECAIMISPYESDIAYIHIRIFDMLLVVLIIPLWE